eukprot:3316368-Rhodomonas_salina.1
MPVRVEVDVQIGCACRPPSHLPTTAAQLLRSCRFRVRLSRRWMLLLAVVSVALKCNPALLLYLVVLFPLDHVPFRFPTPSGRVPALALQTLVSRVKYLPEVTGGSLFAIRVIASRRSQDWGTAKVQRRYARAPYLRDAYNLTRPLVFSQDLYHRSMFSTERMYPSSFQRSSEISCKINRTKVLRRTLGGWSSGLWVWTVGDAIAKNVDRCIFYLCVARRRPGKRQRKRERGFVRAHVADMRQCYTSMSRTSTTEPPKFSSSRDHTACSTGRPAICLSISNFCDVFAASAPLLFDTLSWYPFGRTSTGVHWGLVGSAASAHWLLSSLLHIPVEVQTVCIFLGPCISCVSVLAAYKLGKEICGASSGAGLLSAALVAMLPGQSTPHLFAACLAMPRQLLMCISSRPCNCG